MKQQLKIVVIGGTGLIGSKVVKNLLGLGHEVIAASPSKGINTLTGEGLAEALTGTDVVVDLANSPSFEDVPVMEFFQTAGRNLLAAENAAGVKHHVALSVVGTDGLQAAGYFRAKLVQENLIKADQIPYTIIRATQFFEFTGAIAGNAMEANGGKISSAMMQPIFSGDVAAAVTKIAISEPLNGTVELAGPEPIRMNELVRQYLTAKGDGREIITDDSAGYFGTPVDDTSLTPGENPLLGPTRFADWLARA
jgi:uncharacterized protein YbjT (DUF2867 family)